jgi:hypothetical protein
MTIKSMYYDHAAYVARSQQNFANKPAGASATYDKFIAFTNLNVFSIGVTCGAAGTSTYTAWNGTTSGTFTAADAITAFRISGTTTYTYGPYVTDAPLGGFRRIQISGTGAGSSTADGGIQLLQGDQFYVQRGTDTTAVQYPVVEYSIAANANISN